MWLAELVTRPVIWGVTKGAQLALRGAKAVVAPMKERLSPRVAEHGGVVNYAINTAIGTVGKVARGTGEFVLGAVGAAGEWVDTVVAPLAKLATRPANNALGFEVRKGAGDLMFLGFGAAGFAVGNRQAKVGLVNYGEMESLTGVPMTPDLGKQALRPAIIDNLGADGELALALHRLRRG